MEGVVAFFDAKNIKASNKFVLAGGLFDSIEDEEVIFQLFNQLAFIKMNSFIGILFWQSSLCWTTDWFGSGKN